MGQFRLLRACVLGLGLSAGLLPLSVGATALERIQSAGAINFGYIDGAAPLSVKSGDNQASGYTVELCQHLAKALKTKLALQNLTVNFVQLQPAEVPDKLAKGEVDLLCTATVDSLARRAEVTYSVPVINGGIGVLLRTDANEALLNVLNGKEAYTGPKWRATINRGLANHTYVVRKGSVSEAWIDKQVERLGVIVKIVTVDDYAKGVEMIDEGKADAFFGERMVLEEYSSKAKDAGNLAVLDRDFNYEPLALAMARNDDDFRLAIDTALSEFYASAEFTELYTRYFGPMDEKKQKLFMIYARR